MSILTLSQRRTLDFIIQYFQSHNHAPTAAEIAAGTGIQSRGVVHRYLRALEAAGHIKLQPRRHRNIELCLERGSRQATAIQLIGQIAAGAPIEALESIEILDMQSVFVGEGRFALRVKGHSMVEEGILDGDIVVCQSAQQADNGQIVVALVDQQDATLKRYERTKDRVILSPANSQLSPIELPADRVMIQGIFIGLLRLA